MKEARKPAIPDIAAEAERVITSMRVPKRGENDMILRLKTNQIRKFLTAVNMVTNKIDVWHMKHSESKELPDDLAAEVKYLKVRLAYQAGRDKEKQEKEVRNFIEKADLFARIDAIGRDFNRYQDFAHFVEALVAYHKFYGGKER